MCWLNSVMNVRWFYHHEADLEHTQAREMKWLLFWKMSYKYSFSEWTFNGAETFFSVIHQFGHLIKSINIVQLGASASFEGFTCRRQLCICHSPEFGCWLLVLLRISTWAKVQEPSMTKKVIFVTFSETTQSFFYVHILKIVLNFRIHKMSL